MQDRRFLPLLLPAAVFYIEFLFAENFFAESLFAESHFAENLSVQTKKEVKK